MILLIILVDTFFDCLLSTIKTVQSFHYLFFFSTPHNIFTYYLTQVKILEEKFMPEKIRM